MRSSLTFILSILLTGQIFSQNDLDFGICRFDFQNYKKSNAYFNSLDSVSKEVRARLTKKISTKAGCLSNYIIFIKGQKIEHGSEYSHPNFKKYFKKRFNDKLNYIYNLPVYEFVFKFNFPKINYDYYFNVYTDSIGQSIGDINISSNFKNGCYLIDKETAISIVEKKWENQKDQVHIGLVFFKKKKCFAWELSRLIEGEKNGYMGTMKTFIINAHNGRIIKRESVKIKYE
jgi:hypothetical protein